MALFKDKYRIPSARLPKWNYASAGWYFVTICVRGQNCVFGEITESEIRLTQLGETASTYWLEIPQHTKGNVRLDELVVMPNHMHGIIVIEKQNAIETLRATSSQPQTKSAISPKAGSLSTIIRSYKSIVKRWATANGYLYFDWQPRFYDHIIRNEKSLTEIRHYIQNNPLKWELDKNNPANLWM